MKIDGVVSDRLNLLRGLAAQFVLVEHMLTYSGFTEVYIGSFGVVIFFVLSGFLIHQNTLTSHHLHQDAFLESYMFKRFFRVFTLYIPVVILCFFVDLMLQKNGLPLTEKVTENAQIKNLFGSLFMLQQNPWSEVGAQIFGFDFLSLKPYGSARPLWTVAIEWWIYVAYGIAVSVYLGYTRLPKALSLTGALFLFSLSIVFFNVVSGIGNNLSILWVLGALMGHVFVHCDEAAFRKLNKFWLLAFLILVGLFVMRLVHMHLSSIYRIKDPYDLVNGVIFSLFFLALLVKSPFRFHIAGWTKASQLMANLSYPLYLSHFTVLSVFYGFGWFANANAGDYLIIFLTSNIIAFVLYNFIDKHHVALRATFIRKTVVNT